MAADINIGHNYSTSRRLSASCCTIYMHKFPISCTAGLLIIDTEFTRSNLRRTLSPFAFDRRWFEFNRDTTPRVLYALCIDNRRHTDRAVYTPIPSTLQSIKPLRKQLRQKSWCRYNVQYRMTLSSLQQFESCSDFCAVVISSAAHGQ